MSHRRHFFSTIASALVALLPIAYILSEAPLVRLTEADPWRGGWWEFYGPVDWLYDETPFKGPLRTWARLCGVEDKFDAASAVRAGRVKIISLPLPTRAPDPYSSGQWLEL